MGTIPKAYPVISELIYYLMAIIFSDDSQKMFRHKGDGFWKVFIIKKKAGIRQKMKTKM